MMLKFIYPDVFIPGEKEFKIYVAIKLLKGKYINNKEAIKLCNCSEYEFDNLYKTFELRYKKMSRGPYGDWLFKKDPKLEDIDL